MVVANAPNVTSIEIRRITLHPNAPAPDLEHARRLAASMEERGLDHPITIYPIDTDWFRLWKGRHRLEAGKMLGWTHLLSLVHPEEPNELDRAIGVLAENLARRTVKPEEATTSLLDILAITPGIQNKDLASRLGGSASTVSRYLRPVSILPDWMLKSTLCSTSKYALCMVPAHQSDKRDAIARQAIAENRKRDWVQDRVNELRGKKPPKVRLIPCELPGMTCQIDPAASLSDIDSGFELWRKARRIAEATGQGMTAMPSIIKKLRSE